MFSYKIDIFMSRMFHSYPLTPNIVFKNDTKINMLCSNVPNSDKFRQFLKRIQILELNCISRCYRCLNHWIPTTKLFAHTILPNVAKGFMVKYRWFSVYAMTTQKWWRSHGVTVLRKTSCDFSFVQQLYVKHCWQHNQTNWGV